MNSPSAIILAAGQGTRMRSSTPKMLHKLCGREMVSLVADAAMQSGLSPIVAVLPPVSEAYTQALGDSVSHVVQNEPLGTGHAALQARDSLKSVDTILILNGDVPLIRPETIQALVTKHTDTKSTLTLLTSTKTLPDGLGRIVRSEDGTVKAIVEERVADRVALDISEINSGSTAAGRNGSGRRSLNLRNPALAKYSSPTWWLWPWTKNCRSDQCRSKMVVKFWGLTHGSSWQRLKDCSDTGSERNGCLMAFQCLILNRFTSTRTRK